MVIFWNYKQSQFPVAKMKPLNFNPIQTGGGGGGGAFRTPPPAKS